MVTSVVVWGIGFCYGEAGIDVIDYCKVSQADQTSTFKCNHRERIRRYGKDKLGVSEQTVIIFPRKV